MQKALIISPENCTGCRNCETVCSLFHEKRSNPAESRITVIKHLDGGIYIPMLCQHCEKPVCAAVCPAGAIVKDSASGAVLLDQDRCFGCKLCVTACPIAGPSINPVTGKVIKCDLCQGDPKCAAFCYDRAIEYVGLDEVGLKRRREKTANLAGTARMIAGPQG